MLTAAQQCKQVGDQISATTFRQFQVPKGKETAKIETLLLFCKQNIMLLNTQATELLRQLA
jgi:hypothetical protein